MMEFIWAMHLIVPIYGLIWLGMRRENDRRERMIRELSQRLMFSIRR